MLRNKALDNVCFMYAIEEGSKISLNTMVYGRDGNVTRRNKWSFDILTLDLFEIIMKQVLKNDPSISKCIIGLPGSMIDGHYHTSDFFKVKQEYIEAIGNQLNVDVEIVNDMDTTLLGHFCDSKDSKVAAIHLSMAFIPKVSYVSDRAAQLSVFKVPSALNHLFPGVEWKSLYQARHKNKIVNKLCTIVTSMTLPDTLVIYSNYLTQADVDEVYKSLRRFDEFKTLKEVILKRSVELDLEKGMNIIAEEYYKIVDMKKAI